MKIFIAFILALCIVTPIQAVQFHSTGVNSEELVRLAITYFINPTLSSRFEERPITDNIHIKVVPNFGNIHSFKIAFATPGPPRQIIISDGFLYGLNQYVAAYLIGVELNDQHFTERYFNYLLWRQRPINNGSLPKSPEKWINFKPTNEAKFEQNKLSFFRIALIDVLLHEIGHHATEGFYDEFTSNKSIRKIEEKADKWAQIAMSNISPGASALGRFFAVGYIFELERWFKFSSSGSYPPYLHRVLSTTEGFCTNVDSATASLCKRIKDEIKKTFSSNASENDYRNRIKECEAYAHFPLANILLNRGNKAEACEHYLRAWKEAKVERAAIHIGSCYDNEYLRDKSNTEALENAKKYYNIAANLGFVEAKVYIDKFFN